MSKSWPQDDVINGRWDDVSDYLDELLLEIDDESKSIFLCSVCSHDVPVYIVKSLVSSGADPSYVFNDADSMRFGSKLNPCTTPIGETILGSAWNRSRTDDVLDALVKMGADVNGFTFSGYTPLQLAIVFGQRKHAENHL